MCLLGANRRHSGGWTFATTGNCERRGRGGVYRRKGNRGGILEDQGRSGIMNDLAAIGVVIDRREMSSTYFR